jgi:hypothetical protein
VYNGNTIPGATYTPSTSNTANINVIKADQSIAFAPIADTAYGAIPIPLAATSSFGLPVSFSVISGPATIIDGNLVVTGAGTITVRATQIGDESINAAAPVDVSFNVAKATLTVIAHDKQMVYGAALPTLTYAITGFVGQDSASSLATLPTLSTGATQTAVGTYGITAAGLVDPNYTAIYVPANLTITQATLNVTIDAKTMVYGGTMPTLTYSTNGLVGSDTVNTLSVTPVLTTVASTSNVGAYPISITVSDPNYNIVVVPAELTIIPAALTITSNSFTINRNQPVPTFTMSYQGLVNGDTVDSLPNQAVVTRNSSSRDAGVYTLEPSDAVAPNYAITYQAGTLTINKTRLTLTVNNTSWYPGLGAAQFSGTYSGFLIDGEDASSLTTQPIFAITGSNATFFNTLISAGPVEALELLKANPSFGNATFPIRVPVGATNATSENYDITVVPGTLTFTAAKSITFLTASNTNAVNGNSVTFTAMTQVFVEVQDPGTQQTRKFGFIPASTVGTVQFKVDGVNVGTPVAVNSFGAASFTSSTLSTGVHTITAVFSSGLGNAIRGNTQSIQIDTLKAAPTATNFSAPETYMEDTPLNLTDIVVSDVDNAPLTVTLTLSNPAAGSLNTGTSEAVTSTYDAITGVWTASGASANVNALLSALTFTPAPSFHDNFTIATSVTDGNLWVTGTKTMTGVATNLSPTDITLSVNTLLENAPAGTVVGTLSTTDINVGDSFTYALVSGVGSTDNASFTIVGDTLKAATSFNFEAKNSYSVRIGSTDAGGLYTEKTFVIAVTDVVELTPTPSAPMVIGTPPPASGGSSTVTLHDPVTGAETGTAIPFPGFNGSISVISADFNNDGISEIIAGAGFGGGPAIAILDSQTGEVMEAFWAFDPAFRGGVNVAVYDVNNDGIMDIIAAAGPGGGPEVRIFNGDGLTVIRAFYAYDQSFSGGVSIASVDFNNDGILDLVTGAGQGGSPHVKVFNGANGDIISQWFAYPIDFTGGVFVAAGDIGNDGNIEVVTGAGQGGAPTVAVWDPYSGALLSQFMAYAEDFTGGVRVGINDGNGDGIADILTGAGPGGGPQVNVFNFPDLDLLFSYYSGDPNNTGGVYVG